ncbi:MAG: hypothetical protein JJ896_03615 [Rhodothermales bacterium]|nr:hypothetical protein [Rhodothermales bacterium]MBO6778722.1 hypothetical protein [Rhodothermales bacterium]
MRAAVLSLLAVLTATDAIAQMSRERADPNRPVKELFWAPTLIGLQSVTPLGSGNLNYSIKHSFGLVSSGVENLWGLDGAANIRFGLDYGLTDRITLGMGRSRYDKVYDFRVKANLLRQTVSGSSPVELAVMGDVGITTLENGFSFQDRLSYAGMVMLARRLSDKVSVQVSPMVSHLNTVYIERDAQGQRVVEENTHLGLGLAASWELNEQVALIVEYMPVLGERSDGTTDAFSIGLDLETGGHVFQLFFSSSDWLIEQHMLARNDDDFFSGDFRWGFNINRVFAL